MRDPEMFLKPELIPQFKEGCKKIGHTVIVTSVDRTFQEQAALWFQGRHPLEEVNQLRKFAKLPQITEIQNRIVTWTMNSKHIPDETGKSRAFDFAIIRDSKICWSLKADVDTDGVSDYLECAVIGEGLGLKSGRSFRNPDYPHLELING